jgi:hypothetical protein
MGQLLGQRQWKELEFFVLLPPAGSQDDRTFNPFG